MGVHSLWDIVGPASRPVRLEALSRKKLAVDASIWIYQFLKAVRDQEGNALKSSHIVGFFRRICKLLYFGILPVFVFDGGAPALKKRTINQRREKRQGKRENAKSTAQKLLAIQLQREAERRFDMKTDNSAPKKISRRSKNDESNIHEENDLVYMEDLVNAQPGQSTPMNSSEIPSTSPSKKLFRRLDEYHLPEIEAFESVRSDARMMTLNEFEELTKDLDDEIDGVDLNTVDPSSQEFSELPLSTQYMILSNLRLRSRLRMGYTKEQLETLFPNSMEFSKFQIQMVQKRNFLTQKLMNASGMNENGNTTRRIAGDKDREYSLQKNNDGWTLSLGSEGKSKDSAIELDEDGNPLRPKSEDEDDDADVEWEDISIHNDEENAQNSQMTEKFDAASAGISGDMNSLARMYTDKEDDKDFQNVLFESMKDNSLQEFEEHQIKQAIEESKKDLLNLKRAEKKILDRDAFDLGDAFGDFPSSFQKKASPISSYEKESSETPKFSLGSSSLFEPPPKNDSSSVSDVTFKKNSAPAIEEVSSSDTSPNMEKPKKKAVPLPSWFNNSTPNHFNTNTIGVDKESSKPTADEEAGLISWNTAKEYIDSGPVIETEDEKECDVEILERPNANDLITDISEPEYARTDSIFNGERLSVATQSTVQSSTQQKASSMESEGKANQITSKEQNNVEIFDYDFSESEEEKLIEQLQNEEIEHERFASIINPNFSSKISDEKLLKEQQRRDKRDSDEVTNNMIQDVQELLQRFGIPYITAPMEAEAQCAELLTLGLVDGIITDDSDCFLFGGDRIYKNMFNQKNYVECYFMSDLERDLGLTRNKLIELAMLLGSDYTEGIKGVGPVLAMEILAEFSSTNSSSLDSFRDWWVNIQNGGEISETETEIQRKLRKKFKGKLFLDNSFPERLVYEAYIRPEVDKDETEFKWGAPDLDQIRTFLMYNVEWSQQKVDEVLVPVIKDMNKKKSEGTQSTLGEFFPREVTQKRRDLNRGKRLKSATEKLTKKRKANTGNHDN